MLDLSKPVQTRDGHPARIIASSIKGADDRIVALVDTGEEEVISIRTADGRISTGYDNAGDLVNVPERRKAYVNLGMSYSKPEFARKDAPEWAVVEVEVEVSEDGLDDLQNVTKVVGAKLVPNG